MRSVLGVLLVSATLTVTEPQQVRLTAAEPQQVRKKLPQAPPLVQRVTDLEKRVDKLEGAKATDNDPWARPPGMKTTNVATGWGYKSGEIVNLNGTYFKCNDQGKLEYCAECNNVPTVTQPTVTYSTPTVWYGGTYNAPVSNWWDGGFQSVPVFQQQRGGVFQRFRGNSCSTCGN